MKKKILFIFGAVAALAVGVVGMSAFEAHVINVTAHIENALTVPLESSGLSFGTVFPEEVFNQTLDIQLSNSFIDAPRVDDIQYVIRQKPKCGIPVPDTTDPVEYSDFVQVTENANHEFACPAGSVMLPLLCPYLSKHEIPGSSLEQVSPGVEAFHGPLTGWTPADTIAWQVPGYLSKQDGDTSDTWNIDLHVPCFVGQCAGNDIPLAYLADPANESQLFGCDLWVEVNGISTPGTKPTTLTVNKVLVPSDDPGKFNLQIDGITKGTDQGNGGTTGAQTVSVGAHTVGEIAGTGTNLSNYTTVIGGDCASDGSITLAVGDQKTCTITNTLKGTTLTVNKVLSPTDDPGKFDLQIDSVTKATNQGNGGTTGAITVSAGAHTVGEVAGTGTNLTGYTTVINGDCASNGNITLATGDHKTCTITNTRKGGTITVHKVVVNNEVGNNSAGDFQMTINAGSVAQDTQIPVAVGTYTIGESDSMGYDMTFSGDCDGNNQVTVGSNENKICTVTNTFPFFTVTVNKVVHNTHGGDAVIGNFNLFIGASGVTSGVPKKVAVGAHLISESGVAGYAATFSGDCDPNTQLLSGVNGDNKTCTITNDDIAPVITLVKNVVGGTKSATDFIMRVDTVPVPSGGSKSVTSNGAGHVITEDALAGYHFTSMTGTGSQGSTCPAALGGSVILNEGEVITCTITNTAN